jgi:preprotein translocase subunit SecF
VTAVPAAVAGDPPRERGVVAAYRRLYYGRTRFDFVRRKRIWFLVSGLVILASVVSLGVRGLNFDIEFVGGTSWTVAANGATVSEARAAIAPLGFAGASVTLLGTGSHQNLQVEAKLGTSRHPTSGPTVNKISEALARVTHHSSVAAVSVEQVGPTWGSQITHKALIALVVFFIMIAIYISIFFEWKMALAAILAVLHDIAVTVGIYSLSGFLVTPDTVVAFLTILGYSLYDTIVVFDRIRDNTKGLGASGKLTFTDVVNLSMNQTLARSINTSLVAILPILSVLVLGANFLGASTLQYFGLALLVGLTSGAYSSIFIASPIVAVLKERESRWTQIRRRLEGRGGTVMLLTPAAVASGALDDREAAGASRLRRGRAAPRPQRREPLRPGAARELGGNGSPEPGEPERSDEEDEVIFEHGGAVGAEAAGVVGAAPAAVSSSGRPSSGSARPGKSQGGASRSGPAPRPRKRRRR